MYNVYVKYEILLDENVKIVLITHWELLDFHPCHHIQVPVMQRIYLLSSRATSPSPRAFLALQSISSRTANTTPLQPGMVVSNEPGYYKGGRGGFGIRIENLLEIVDTGIVNETLGKR